MIQKYPFWPAMYRTKLRKTYPWPIGPRFTQISYWALWFRYDCGSNERMIHFPHVISCIWAKLHVFMLGGSEEGIEFTHECTQFLWWKCKLSWQIAYLQWTHAIGPDQYHYNSWSLTRLRYMFEKYCMCSKFLLLKNLPPPCWFILLIWGGMNLYIIVAASSIMKHAIMVWDLRIVYVQWQSLIPALD